MSQQRVDDIVNAAGTGAPAFSKGISGLQPTIQKLTSGSGTYTLPSNCKWIRVRMVGGGSGGDGTAGGGGGGTGGNSTFGTSLLVANGASRTAGGTVSLGTGPVGIAIVGSIGSGGGATGSGGAAGAPSPFGGAGGGGDSTTAGSAGVTNSGSGGGAGGGDGAAAGRSGSAGGFVDAIITSPDATYAYAVGSAGSAGTGTRAGGAGGSGIIVVEEHYV